MSSACGSLAIRWLIVPPGLGCWLGACWPAAGEDADAGAPAAVVAVPAPADDVTAVPVPPVEREPLLLFELLPQATRPIAARPAPVTAPLRNSARLPRRAVASRCQ